MLKASSNPNQQQTPVSADAKLVAARKVFEEKAAELLQGQLWRHLLTNPADAFLTKFFADKFEEEGLRIDQLQPVVSTIQTTFAFDIEDNPTSKWRRREQAYFNELNVDDINRLREELVRIIDEISKPQIQLSESQSYTIAQLLVGYSENLHRSLQQYDDYQRLVTKLTESDFTKALNFLYKAKRLETLLIDIMMLLKASRLRREECLTSWTLLKNPIRCQWISNTVLIKLLSPNGNSVLNLIAEPLVYGQAPSELLKRLTDEEWQLCLQESIGIYGQTFFHALIRTPQRLLEVCSKQAIIDYARKYSNFKDCTPASAVITCPQLMPSLDDETLVDLFTLITGSEVENILASNKRRDIFIEAILRIAASPDMRKAYYKQSGSKHTINAKYWLINEYVLSKLNTKNFLYCISLLTNLALKRLLKDKNTYAQAFRVRLIQLSSDELIELAKHMNQHDKTASMELLRNAEVANRLNNDKKLPVYMQLVSDFLFSKILAKSIALKACLQGDTLLEVLIVIAESVYNRISLDKEVIERANKDAIYDFIINHDPKLEASQVNRLLGIGKIAEELTDEQLLNLKAIYGEQSWGLNRELHSRNISNGGYQFVSEELTKNLVSLALCHIALKNANVNSSEQEQGSPEVVENQLLPSNSSTVAIEADRIQIEQPVSDAEKLGNTKSICKSLNSSESATALVLQPTIYNDQSKPPSHIRQTLNAIWDSRSIFYCLLGVGFAATCFIIGWTLPTFILAGILATGLALETAVTLYKLASYCFNVEIEPTKPVLQQDKSALFSGELVFAPTAKLTGQQVTRNIPEQQPSVSSRSLTPV